VLAHGPDPAQVLGGVEQPELDLDAADTDSRVRVALSFTCSTDSCRNPPEVL
jgi:hypothetical protein